MTSKKRKLPTVGIFDPNFSEDPQYGNVSTLADGLKRIHFHLTMQPVNLDRYYRYSIMVPECSIPKISSHEIDSVEQISVPVVKNFHVEMTEPGSLENKVTSSFYVGLFECDKFDLGPLHKLDGSDPGFPIPTKDIVEPSFIINKPAAYSCFENGGRHDVSNLSERGYIFLQNYFNLFVGFRNMEKQKQFSFNVYIDYKVCQTSYREALIWKSDFESMIQNRLRYRADIKAAADQIYVALCSRGLVESEDNADPSKFNEHTNNTKIFKVPARPTEEASLDKKELVWARAMKKFLGKPEEK